MGSIASFGSGILAYAPFTNTGEIRVDRCNSGVVSTSTFTNTGQITIGASASLSAQGVVSTGASATFVNSGVGIISIDRTGGNGLSNANGSTFTNSATITIGVSAMVGSAGINNEGTFASISQSACALLTVYGTISNSGDFVNDGLFTVNTTQPHSNISLTNNGIIIKLRYARW